jgi:hypothetical protein
MQHFLYGVSYFSVLACFRCSLQFDPNLLCGKGKNDYTGDGACRVAAEDSLPTPRLIRPPIPDEV